MASEIRANSITSRAGLSTVTLTDSGPMFSGITTFVDNSTFSVGTGGTIHAPATNTLNIGVNNTESLRIDSNSNLKVAGIVTATHFYGNGSNLTGTQTTINNNANNRIITGSGTANTLEGEANLTFNGSQLTVAGKIACDVNSDISMSGSADGQLVVGGNGYTGAISLDGTAMNIYHNSSSRGIIFGTNETERLRIDSSGRLLTGGATTSQGSTNADDLQIGANNQSNQTGITLGSASGSSIRFADAANDTAGAISYYHSDNALRFTANGSERLRINSNGDIGVNVTTINRSSTLRNTIQFDYSGSDGSEGLEIRLSNSALNGNAATDNAAITYIGQDLGITNRENGNIKFSNNGSERLRINSNGSIQITPEGSTSNPYMLIDTSGDSVRFNAQKASGNNEFRFLTQSSGTVAERLRIDSSGISKFMNFGGGQIHLGGGSAHSPKVTVTDNAGTGNGNFIFAGPSGEHLRVNSAGRVLISTTSIIDSSSASLVVRGNYPVTPIEVQQSSSNNHYAITFRNSSGFVGNIITLGGGTTYNTSSDYRAKENVITLTDAITRLKTLSPKRFNYIVDSSRTMDGFLAHEVSSAVPEAISGTKDEVDSDNNPVYQGIDHSRLVPLLTAAIQEAITKIETLEQDNITLRARVTNLEGN